MRSVQLEWVVKRGEVSTVSGLKDERTAVGGLDVLIGRHLGNLRYHTRRAMQHTGNVSEFGRHHNALAKVITRRQQAEIANRGGRPTPDHGPGWAR